MTSSQILFFGPQDEVGEFLSQLAVQVVQSVEELREIFKSSGGRLWVGRDSSLLKSLADVVLESHRRDRLLLLEPVSSYRATFLRAYFERVIIPSEMTTVVSEDVLAAILGEEYPGDYIIGGVYDPDDDVLIFHRGDLQTLVVPIEWFERPVGRPPDFEDLEVIDHGQTVRLGTFEASTDALLYNFDREYRQRAKKRRLEEDDSFGACLRRLRLERGVRQDDFGEVTARTIRRIEKGSVSAPHRRTMEIIAERLGVEPEEIGEW